MLSYVLFMQQLEVNSNMALALGNLLGAVANATTAVAHEKTLKSFLTNINDFGVQVKNNFEVNFSGLQDITFRVTDMTLPTVKANTTEIFYDGRSIPVTVNYDYEHDFSMTILNDAQGYIYPAIAEFIMTNATTELANGGYTMTVKVMTGDKKYDGMMITCKGVKLVNLGALSYGQSQNEIQTFEVQGQMQEFVVTPGALGTVANVGGIVTSLFG